MTRPYLDTTMAWRRLRRLTVAVTLAWLLLNLLAPWYARDLHQWLGYGPPFSFWLLAQGMQVIYLLLLVVFVVASERIEAAVSGPDADRPAHPPDDEDL